MSFAFYSWLPEKKEKVANPAIKYDIKVTKGKGDQNALPRGFEAFPISTMNGTQFINAAIGTRRVYSLARFERGQGLKEQLNKSPDF